MDGAHACLKMSQSSIDETAVVALMTQDSVANFHPSATLTNTLARVLGCGEEPATIATSF